MFEGNIDEGELEIGQVSGLIHEIKPAGKILEEMVEEFRQVRWNYVIWKFEMRSQQSAVGRPL